LTTSNLYQKIITEKNIREAYLEVYESFLKKSKVFDYDVIDGQQIHETELNLKEFLEQIRQEIIENKPLRLAQSIAIPKKNGKLRKIYMVPVRERIKCQAVYRVLQAYIKPHYSKYLYSFRSERPSYFALRSLRRYYLSNVNKGYFLLKTDFKDYSDHINKTILLDKLRKLGVDEQTIGLLKQFIEISFVRKGEWSSMSEGTMQGIPLVSLFNNIYMSQIDEKFGAEAEFYRRVGDDVIILDRDRKKLENALEYIKSECLKMKIILNQDKTLLQPMEGLFEYLGLAFEKGKIFLPKSKVDKIIRELKILFKTNSKSQPATKLSRIKQVLLINKWGRSAVLLNHVNPHTLVTDGQYLQKLSLRIMKVLWAYLGGGFTAKKLAKGRMIMKKSDLRLNSFFDHFAGVIYPRYFSRK
jgi:hypothetical protein